MSRLTHAPDDNGSPPSYSLRDEGATLALGAALAAALVPGLVIYLEGDLGAGKTTLARGVLRALNFTGNVKSPTYTLIEPYTVSRLHLYHFDFYRFTAPDEFQEAGLEEYFTTAGVCLVEWPDKAQPNLPSPDLRILLRIAAHGRGATIIGVSERGHECAKAIREALS